MRGAPPLLLFRSATQLRRKRSILRWAMESFTAKDGAAPEPRGVRGLPILRRDPVNHGEVVGDAQDVEATW